MNRKHHLLLTVVLVFPLLQLQFAASGEEPSKRAPDVRRTSEPVDRYPAEPLPLPGIVQPSSQVTMSAPVEGMLMEVRVREGQRVEQGDILAVLDNRVAQAAVNVARIAADQTGEIQQSREELNFSKIHFDRQLELKAATGGSGFELLEAETRYEKAKAALLSVEQNQRRAQGMLELELARLEAHNIRAPFSGEILRLQADPGATLTRDDDLLTIICVDELEVELYIPLAHYEQLQVGGDYPLVAGAPVNRTVTGRLKYVAPVIDSATRAVRAVFTLDNHDLNPNPNPNPNPKLPAGFSVQLDTQNLTQRKSLAGSRSTTRSFPSN
jgi:RND family efflux transporter MFP subunit